MAAFTFHDLIILFACAIGLFTSFFFLIVMLSPSKKKYAIDRSYTPKVTIIIPFWNEAAEGGKRLRRTLDSLMALDYPRNKLEIIAVDDGSTDASLSVVDAYASRGITVISHKRSKGKTFAVNEGMKHATGDLVAALDADSFLLPDTLRKLVPCFKDQRVMAAVPSVKIWQPKSLLQRIQAHEFLSAAFIRHIQSEIGAVPMAPGAFTLIRKSFIDTHGGLRTDTMVEDLEMTLRIQKEHYLIENVTNAAVYTSGVRTLKQFFNQRLRWFLGFFIQMRNYHHLISPKYGNLGMFVLPSALLYVLLSLFLFIYGLGAMAFDAYRGIHTALLIGIPWREWLSWQFDLYFVTLSNVTVLPFVLFGIMLLFTVYIKRESEEKQGVVANFAIYSVTYWALGALCWLLAAYFYITKRKVRWGPNYFDS